MSPGATPEQPARPDTHAKALAINLDSRVYGSFAEIGAGQEVARWFLTVGGASGTVAQTISAYDKTFSDDTYGAGTRYVSRERLLKMLDREYSLLVQRLAGTRPDTRFFAFADTVAARNYKGDNRQHGWVGVRFQTRPGGEASDILLHVNLKDSSALRQQQSLGVLGVNLIHAALFHSATPHDFLAALWDGLSLDNMEIDVLTLSGPAFRHADERRWCLDMLCRGMAHALMFTREGAIVEPADILYKRPLVIDRGRFGTLEPHHARMLDAGLRALHAEEAKFERDPVGLVELSVRPMEASGRPIQSDPTTLLERVQSLGALGPVLVTDYSEMFRVVSYLRQHTTEPLRFIGGVSLLAKILEDRFYQSLPGALMEGLGKIFAQNVKYYSYPMPREVVLRALVGSSGNVMVSESSGDTVNADDLRCKPPISHLFDYLRAGGWVAPIDQ